MKNPYDNSKLADLIPDRPIRVRRTGMDPATSMANAALLVLLALCLSVWQVPVLKRDYRISQDYLVLPAGWVSGWCETRLFVVTACLGSVSVERPGRVLSRNVALLYLEANLSRDDIIVDVVYAADDVSNLTISPAVEQINNRIFSFGALIALLAIGAVMSLKGFRKAARIKKLTRQPVLLKLVAVDEVDYDKSIFHKEFEYAYAGEDGNPHHAKSAFTRGEEPFRLEARHYLAALPEGSSLPIILDDGLSRLDINRAERRKILDALTKPSFWRRLFG